MNKISIDERYFPNEELSHSNLPYQDLLSCLDELFVSYDSLFDAGCRDGKLLEEIKIKHSNVLINGCDYFQFVIDSCPLSIKNSAK